MMSVRKEMEEAGEKGTVASLPVKNVQALAGEDVDDVIIRRYVRPEITEYPVHCSDEVPVIDLVKLYNPELADDENAKLQFACQEWGFFQLINHGISDEVIEDMKVVIQEFFQLPLEVKERFAQLPGDLQGYGQNFVVSEDQKLDWGDRFYLRTQPLRSRNMIFWPDHPPKFRDALDIYTSNVREVAHQLFGLIATTLGAEPKKFIDMFESQSVRINYYPPCPQADKVLGLSPHSDPNGLTILRQINEVQGLQIKKSGAWIPIKPLPGAFIVNLGDTLEVLSNGKYKSIEHRVVINPKKERLSIATFQNLNAGFVVGPLPEIVRDGEVCYRTTSIENFMKLFFSNKLDGKKLIDLMKLVS